VLGAAAVLLLTGCTADHGRAGPATSVRTTTQTKTRTASPSAGPTAPLGTGPTITARAAACPLLDEQVAADRVGMRLARITVQRSGGRVVGCRFYALQNSPLSQSEHLPGPHQPAIEIRSNRYASTTAAHNAVVLAARRGTNVQPAKVADFGACYQLAFFADDHGADWACAFQTGARVVEVKTVVVSPALNVISVARDIAGRL
jgi:hypothetical protein